MKDFSKEQLWYLSYGRKHGLNTALFANPRYTAKRMDAIVTALEEDWDKEVQFFLLDKSVSDTDAERLQYHILNGGTFEDFFHEDPELS